MFIVSISTVQLLFQKRLLKLALLFLWCCKFLLNLVGETIGGISNMSFSSKQSVDLALSFERMSAKDLKSADQIRRHSIDSRLEGKTVERAIHIFTVGDEVQKLSVVNSIPELFLEDKGLVLQALMPKVLQALSGSSTEYQVTMAATVRTVVREKILPAQQCIDYFLQVTVQNMDHKDGVVANSWSETLIEIIQVLPLDTLKNHVSNLVLQRTQLIRPAFVRASSCQIIGELAKRYDLPLIKKDIVPIVNSLSQDLDLEVRVAMASHLSKVINALKNETFRTTVGTALLELLGDEAVRVKEAAFKALANVLDVVGLDNVKTHLLPMVKQLIHFGFKNDDSLLVAISESYGKVCLGIEKVTSEKEMFVKYYITMAGMGAPPSRRKATSFPEPAFHIVHTSLNPEKYVLCRQAAASNFPSMCKFVEGSASLIEMLQGTLNELNTDSYYVVRRLLAQGLAEACNNLGKSAVILKNNVLQLLLDEAEEVLEGFFLNLSSIIENLIRIGVYKVDPPPKDTSVSDLNKAILRCESIIFPSHNWRLYSTFMSQIQCIYKFNASDVQFNNYISLFLKRLHATRSVPVRLSLVKTVLVFLRYLQKPSQRSEVRNRIINEFCLSTSFYNRIFYLRTCTLIWDVFSTYYFKEYFFFRTIQMMDDPVPNVRWALLMMLPKLKQMSRHPSEKKMQALVDMAVLKFSEDKDKEVVRQFEFIKGLLDVNDQKLFLNDTKKFEEERKLIGATDTGRPGGVSDGGSSTPLPSSTGGMVPGSGLRKPPGSDPPRPPPNTFVPDSRRSVSRSPSVTPPASPRNTANRPGPRHSNIP